MPRLLESPTNITVELDGQSVPACSGEPVAASLIAAGESLFSRSIKYHRARGAFCFSAACAGCLMRVDGVPNVFTCRTEAKEGLRLERQNAFPSAKLDAFAATDWIFFKGLNHHELFAGVPVAQEVMAWAARKLAGLGQLPDSKAPQREPAVEEHFPVIIVGAGVSGLSASRELFAKGISHVVLERDDFIGGRGAYSSTAVQVPAEKHIRLRHNVVGLFEDEKGRFIAVLANERLHKFYGKKWLIAMGTHPTLPPFTNNDLPGIYAARAVRRLLHRHRISVGSRIAVVGNETLSTQLAQELNDAGIEALRVGEHPVAAHGIGKVSSLTFTRDGKEESVSCDAVALALDGSPAFELARQGGAKVIFRNPHFVVEAEANGKTAHADLFVCGEQTGPCDEGASAESGRAAALAIVEGLS